MLSQPAAVTLVLAGAMAALRGLLLLGQAARCVGQVTHTGVGLSTGDAYSSAVSAKAVDKAKFSPQVPSKLLEKMPAASAAGWGVDMLHSSNGTCSCSLNEWAGAS